MEPDYYKIGCHGKVNTNHTHNITCFEPANPPNNNKRINNYIDSITRDLNELRNPKHPIFAEPKQDTYARIYQKLGTIKGLTQ